MAIFHCQAKALNRSSGRTATSAAAYRACDKIRDDRTGEVHDYTRKRGLELAEIVTQDGKKIDRATLWNAAEAAEKRKDAKIAREWELALPDELTRVERASLARAFAKMLVTRYGIAADICIHSPGKDGDQRNHHAHIMTTTRVFADGKLGEKTRILDSPKTSGKEIEAVRLAWANMVNRALERGGHDARIDHRSLKAQGIDRAPTVHLGPIVTRMERRGVRTERGDLNRTQAHKDSKELATLERQTVGVTQFRERARKWNEGIAAARRWAEQEHKRREQERQAELARLQEQQEQELRRQREELARKHEQERQRLQEERERERQKQPQRNRGLGMGR